MLDALEEPSETSFIQIEELTPTANLGILKLAYAEAVRSVQAQTALLNQLRQKTLAMLGITITLVTFLFKAAVDQAICAECLTAGLLGTMALATPILLGLRAIVLVGVRWWEQVDARKLASEYSVVDEERAYLRLSQWANFWRLANRHTLDQLGHVFNRTAFWCFGLVVLWLLLVAIAALETAG